MVSSESYEFGSFTLNASERRLARGGRPIALAPKAADVLVALVRNAGRLVTKEQLLALVWPSGDVTEGILSVHVSTLRKALGDTGRSPEFIETVARSGYRFVAAVTDAGRESSRRIVPASIAVLPFENLNGDSASLYFSDGLTEEVIFALTRMPSLRVTPRTSAFAFRRKRDLAEIARVLNVKMILEGAVRREGDRARVTVQLIDAANGSHIWSERYDRALGDVLCVQHDVAISIAEALRIELDEAGRRAARPVPERAHEAYLKGLYELRQMTAASLLAACECFDQAIAHCPEYAAAHVGLAATYLCLATESLAPAREAMPAARSAAAKALALNPADADALAILGSIALTYDYDAEEADRVAKRLAGRIDSFNTAYFQMGYGGARRPLAEAPAFLGRLLELDPLNALFRSIHANAWMWLGDYDRARAECATMLELGLPYYGAYFVIAQCFLLEGRASKALEPCTKLYEMGSWHPRNAGLMAAVYARNGDCPRAERVLGEIRRSASPLGVPMGMLLYHSLVGDAPRALDWYERAVAEREPLALAYVVDPLMKPLRSDPRWKALRETMRLPASVG